MHLLPCSTFLRLNSFSAIVLRDIRLHLSPVRFCGIIQPVKTAPGGENIDFRVVKGRLEFTVPAIKGRQMIELSYRE